MALLRGGGSEGGVRDGGFRDEAPASAPRVDDGAIAPPPPPLRKPGAGQAAGPAGRATARDRAEQSINARRSAAARNNGRDAPAAEDEQAFADPAYGAPRYDDAPFEPARYDDAAPYDSPAYDGAPFDSAPFGAGPDRGAAPEGAGGDGFDPAGYGGAEISGRRAFDDGDPFEDVDPLETNDVVRETEMRRRPFGRKRPPSRVVSDRRGGGDLYEPDPAPRGGDPAAARADERGFDADAYDHGADGAIEGAVVDPDDRMEEGEARARGRQGPLIGREEGPDRQDATAGAGAPPSIDLLSAAEWETSPADGGASDAGFEEAARAVEERKALRSASGSRPFSLEERMLAGRYLRARRKEGFISVIAALSLLGIALGVAILIIVMSVMNGFRAELVDKIVGVNGHLMVMSLRDDFTDFRDTAAKIRTVPGVTRAAPLVEGQALASAPRNSLGVVVRGVSKEDLLNLEKVAVDPEISYGSLSQFEGDAGVAIGQRLAFKLGLNVGDSIRLTSPRGAATPFGVMPRSKTYRVVYIFKVGMAQYDEGVVFMPLFEAQKFFNKNGAVDAIEVMVATPERLTGYREDIQEAVDRDIFINDWQESHRSLIGALKTERTVMFLILSFLILIASLIIISGMIMLVKEKGKDIAILRTMGMSKRAVMRVFFMCGASIGLVGTVMGMIIGLAFCANIDQIADAVSYLANGDVFPEDIYMLSKLPAQVHTEDVLMTVGISLGLSFFATLYPAWRAARLDPVEALRYE